MSGRARMSEYYKLALLKLKDAKKVLKEGTVFELPIKKDLFHSQGLHK